MHREVDAVQVYNAITLFTSIPYVYFSSCRSSVLSCVVVTYMHISALKAYICMHIYASIFTGGKENTVFHVARPFTSVELVVCLRWVVSARVGARSWMTSERWKDGV